MSHGFWMFISGLTGFSCFVMIHFTKLLKDFRLAATLQLSANTFVFVSWGSAFLSTTGLFQLLALGGTIVPVIMASITVRKVRRHDPVIKSAEE